MKIRGGGPSYHPANVNQANQAKDTKKKSKAGKASKASATGTVSSATALAPADELDSPLYDEVVFAAQKLDEDDLEEATRAVVTAVIREHFGSKNLPKAELEEITNAVSSTVTGDEDLSGRLESVLRRITASRKKAGR